MKFKKSVKTRKNEKMQHLNGCFKSIKQFQSNFENFNFFVASFERKMAKNVYFVIFSKIVIFGKKLISPLYFSRNFLSKNVYVCKLSCIG